MTEPEPDWGLAALGVGGDVQIDVDETCSGPKRWELSIDCPRFYLRFAISGPSTIGHFRDFLAHHLNQSTSGELVLGTLCDSTVSIIKDDEFDDRYFLRVLARDGAVYKTLIGEEVSDFIAALTQACSDLEE